MKIFIFYSTAGEGHKKIAEAVLQEFKRQGHANVHGLDAFEKVSPFFRASYPTIYFYLVKYATRLWGFLYHASDCHAVAKFLAPFRSFWNRLHSNALRKFIKEENPDVMIVTHFYAAEVIATAKKRGELPGALITIITDALPHAFWINSGTDYYWVMCEENKKILMQRGVPERQIMVGGIPVDHKFLESENRVSLRAKYGLQQNRFTILFTSGSFGLGPTVELLRALEKFEHQIQAVVVCGHNQTLYESLNIQAWKFPVILTGFTDKMYEIMSLADVMIAKSGGATMCESLVKELPMMISAPIPGQETRNRDWLFAHEAALSIRLASGVENHIKSFLEDSKKLSTLKDNIRKIAKPNAAFDLVKFVTRTITP